MAPAPSPASEGLELTADFDVSVYQGDDVLRGESVVFSDAFAQGKPVVLGLWARLYPICRIEMPELEQAYATTMRAYRVLETLATNFLKPDGEIIEQGNGLLTGGQFEDKIQALLGASRVGAAARLD